MRVLHYLNQFFGGIGGEERADAPPQALAGAAGPGRLLEQVLPEGSSVVATLVCGDNYAAEHLEELASFAVAQAQEWQADLILAGPCFESGRYGVAAGAVCVAVGTQLNLPAVAGMDAESPGVDLYRGEVYIVNSGPGVARMSEALTAMTRLGIKLAQGETLGRPADEGYIPQGLLRSEFVARTSAQRLGDMLLAKLKGEPYASEIPLQAAEPVPAPAPVAELSQATVALVTDGGLVPKGNPDQFPRGFSRVWGAYNIEEQDGLRGEDYEVAHGGYDNRHVQQDPDRLVPVDVMREMERAGVIGRLHQEFFSTTGNTNPLDNSRRIGREIAQRLKEAAVDSVILTST